ncbi:hypothetical protein ACLOJK_029649 [Asimina triloba]
MEKEKNTSDSSHVPIVEEMMTAEHDPELKWPNGMSFVTALTVRTEDAKLLFGGSGSADSMGSKPTQHSFIVGGSNEVADDAKASSDFLDKKRGAYYLQGRRGREIAKLSRAIPASEGRRILEKASDVEEEVGIVGRRLPNR